MENKIAFISSLGKISFFLMLIFSVFLFTVKSDKRSSNYILGLMLLLVAFDLSGFFIGDWFEQHLLLNSIKTASSLLQMPLFLYYVVSVCFSNFRIKPIHILHSFLFISFLILFIITYLSNGILTIYEIVSEIQWLAYMFAVFFYLKKYKNIHLENYSKSNSKAYKWLFQFAVLSCVGHSFVFIKSCLSYLNYDVAVLNLNILISISILLITTWFVLKALYHPQLFTGMQTDLKPIQAAVRKLKSTEDSLVHQKDKEKLLSFMDLQKPFLDFELTLQKLATQFDMPEKELSILINHHMGKHFFDFINEYRIEAAKIILGNPQENERTVLEVLYAVGFNSKSSFYTAFKKITGKTPTTYRKERLAS